MNVFKRRINANAISINNWKVIKNDVLDYTKLFYIADEEGVMIKSPKDIALEIREIFCSIKHLSFESSKPIGKIAHIIFEMMETNHDRQLFDICYESNREEFKDQDIKYLKDLHTQLSEIATMIDDDGMCEHKLIAKAYTELAQAIEDNKDDDCEMANIVAYSDALKSLI